MSKILGILACISPTVASQHASLESVIGYSRDKVALEQVLLPALRCSCQEITTPAYYSGGPLFKYRSRDRLYDRFLVVLLSPFTQDSTFN